MLLGLRLLRRASGAAIAGVAGLDDGVERLALVGGVALHGLDQVGDQVDGGA